MAGTPRVQLDFDKVYHSNSYGDFKIIKDLGRDERSRLYVRIKFIETGTEKDIRYDYILAGKASDDLYGIDFNAIYTSIYYGQYKIIKFVGRNRESKRIVRIKFLDTGFETDTLLRLAQSGIVKDKTISYEDRRVRTNNEEEYVNILFRILEERWKAMMSRCYNPHSDSYYDYGRIGVTVCEQWRTLEGFLSSIQFVPGFQRFYFQPENYHLDKDFLQQDIPKSKRVYSPSTCIFLSVEDNSNLAIKGKHKGYHGIRKTTNGHFEVVITTKNGRKSFGVYSDYLVALNEYNYYYKQHGCYELVPLFNENIPFIDHTVAQQYLVQANVK